MAYAHISDLHLVREHQGMLLLNQRSLVLSDLQAAG